MIFLSPKCSSQWNTLKIYKNNVRITVNFFFSRVRRFGNYFCKWESDQKIGINSNPYIIYLSNVLSTQTCCKIIISCSFRHFCQGRCLCLGIVRSTQFNQWHHANARYWHCDFILVDCPGTHKLAQKRYSPENNYEYWFPATRGSQFSV